MSATDLNSILSSVVGAGAINAISPEELREIARALDNYAIDKMGDDTKPEKQCHYDSVQEYINRVRSLVVLVRERLEMPLNDKTVSQCVHLLYIAEEEVANVEW